MANKIAHVDLRNITRESDRIKTVVSFVNRYGREEKPWLTLGMCDLIYGSNSNLWNMRAFMKRGVTDFEHDSVRAVCLPLIGVSFESIFYGRCTFSGWIDPALGPLDNFHFPLSSEYDPTKHKDALI